MSAEAGANTDWVSGIGERVERQLARRSPESQDDVYVWSDGSVTGPQESEGRAETLRLVATFTPGEHPSRDEIEQSVRNGLATVPKGGEATTGPS